MILLLVLLVLFAIFGGVFLHPLIWLILLVALVLMLTGHPRL